MTDRSTNDFSKGPVWNPAKNRWLVEIRYPDGSRLRRRLRRERDALRLWTAEQTKLETGTWSEQAPPHVTVAAAFEAYRTYSKVQHRSYRTYVDSALTLWEAHLGAQTLLAKVTSQQVEAFKLTRTQQVSRATTDKNLAVLKAVFNWCMAHQMASSNPVRRVKLFHEDNARLRYLTTEEYDRLIAAARTITTSPYLVDKIVLATHTGLRRGSLFQLRWDEVDLALRVLRIPRTKNGRPLSVPLNATALQTLQALHNAKTSDSAYVFAHASGRYAGDPVRDSKNAFHTALELANIEAFTWHDLRHTFASWLMMRGASLRSVGELLGHQSVKMTLRYAHLSPAYLAAEVGLLDGPATAKDQSPAEGESRAQEESTGESDPIGEGKLRATSDTPIRKRARKGQRGSAADQLANEVRDFVRENGSPHWTISATG